VSRRLSLENGEALVISVTPVAQGLLTPLALLVLLEAAVIWGTPKWKTLYHYEAIVILVVGVLPALVLIGRSWRWRSHKITVTTQRIVITGGVLGRYSTELNLSDVFATHATQTLGERLRRRGVVFLETRSGTVMLEPVRYPAALRRLIDRTRRDATSDGSPTWDQWFDDPAGDSWRDDPQE
jgi:membrane protein YdbS with pleckstrin-like domain